MAAPFSLRLDPALKSRLEDEARQQDRPASYVATKAIEQFLDAQDAKREAIERASVEADAGVFVSASAVHRWMDGWDGSDELPEPDADIKPTGR
ncbi:hypothetical protein [Mycoplana sp. MJR14]|uniref:CopG family ribbon-helix-helix protein n=1 Tax=Mycoplana sp. MJR14 TaxID=3032583 RepID=UPI0023DA6D09|nr:hypothetical protein [Mycoplana sp. MJR14]MDF1633810.1 hypothetical protein [Mycoplana sp. MJR14]